MPRNCIDHKHRITSNDVKKRQRDKPENRRNLASSLCLRCSHERALQCTAPPSSPNIVPRRGSRRRQMGTGGVDGGRGVLRGTGRAVSGGARLVLAPARWCHFLCSPLPPAALRRCRGMRGGVALEDGAGGARMQGGRGGGTSRSETPRGERWLGGVGGAAEPAPAQGGRGLGAGSGSSQQGSGGWWRGWMGGGGGRGGGWVEEEGAGVDGRRRRARGLINGGGEAGGGSSGGAAQASGSFRWMGASGAATGAVAVLPPGAAAAGASGRPPCRGR